MKTILDIEEYGISITYNPDCELHFEVEFPDPAAPETYIDRYMELPSAIDRVVELILDPNQVYAMEDQPAHIQDAYKTVSRMPKARETAATFLGEVLYSLAYTQMNIYKMFTGNV